MFVVFFYEKFVIRTLNCCRVDVGEGSEVRGVLLMVEGKTKSRRCCKLYLLSNVEDFYYSGTWIVPTSWSSSHIAPFNSRGLCDYIYFRIKALSPHPVVGFDRS
jgi:hypothetical protein